MKCFSVDGSDVKKPNKKKKEITTANWNTGKRRGEPMRFQSYHKQNA